jgi:hypothetical protein
MTENIELLNFIQRISSEVHDRASGGSESDGSVDFKENVFVEYVLEHLEEMGIVENPEVCHFERRAPRGSLRVNGFAVNDDGDTLDLFAITGYLPPRTASRLFAMAMGNWPSGP